MGNLISLLKLNQKTLYLVNLACLTCLQCAANEGTVHLYLIGFLVRLNPIG